MEDLKTTMENMAKQFADVQDMAKQFTGLQEAVTTTLDKHRYQWKTCRSAAIPPRLHL